MMLGIAPENIGNEVSIFIYPLNYGRNMFEMVKLLCEKLEIYIPMKNVKNCLPKI